MKNDIQSLSDIKWTSSTRSVVTNGSFKFEDSSRFFFKIRENRDGSASLSSAFHCGGWESIHCDSVEKAKQLALKQTAEFIDKISTVRASEWEVFDNDGRGGIPIAKFSHKATAEVYSDFVMIGSSNSQLERYDLDVRPYKPDPVDPEFGWIDLVSDLALDGEDSESIIDKTLKSFPHVPEIQIETEIAFHYVAAAELSPA